jgi:hypothetical protein
MKADVAIPRNSYIWPRSKLDHYVDPPWVSQRHFDVEPYVCEIVDPAEGLGRIRQAARDHGHCAVGYYIATTGHDFFASNQVVANIVSNPPFDIIEEFTRHALKLARHKVALIWPTRRFNAARWLQQTPLARIWLLTPRPSMPPASVVLNGGNVGNGTQDFAWLVWCQGYTRQTGGSLAAQRRRRRAMRIISAAERNTAPRGAKALIVGPTGVGKTSLLRTVDPASTLLIDIECGDLAVQDVKTDTLRPRTWPECRDLAVILAGPNPAVPPDACYSEAHHAAVIRSLNGSWSPDRYQTYFIDSITAAGRLCFAWASQQPEAFSSAGKKDLRGSYGLLAREMLAWLMQLQQARTINVIFVGILETVTDDFNRTEHRLQMEGARTSRELPAIVDQVITMNWVDFGDGAPTRAFVCTSPNQWRYPAKDRSGRLQQIEQPHLGRLLAKLSAKTSDGDFAELEAVQPK